MSAYAYDDEPIFGKKGEPITGEVLAELLRRQSPFVASARKARAAVAHCVYTGDLRGLIIEAIGRQQKSETLRHDMRRFVSALRNDARDVTEAVAVLYKNGATRHLGGDGDESDTATTEQEEALRKLALECAIDEVGEQINHLAWLQGPQFAVPMVRSGRLTIDVVGPHIYDIVQDEDDPYGMPVGLAWPVGERKIGEDRETRVYVLDAVSLRLFAVRRQGFIEINDPIEHDYGSLPASLLRFSRPLVGDDWYLVDRQRRLTDGTIEVGVLMARLALVRKAQCLKLLTVVGDLSTMPMGQEKSNPETSILANTGSQPRGGKPEIKVEDYDTDPSKFIRHILFDVLCMIEPYGGHLQVDSGQPDIYGKVVIPPDVQAEHRRRQIKAAVPFEQRFWGCAVAMMHADGHPLALDLPPSYEIEERLRVSFGELTRALEDPAQAMAQKDWELSRGLTSEVQIVREALGGVSTEEAEREIERRLEERSWFNEQASSRNLVTTIGGSVQRTPEANGALGTPAREANRAQAQADAEGAGGPTMPPPT